MDRQKSKYRWVVFFAVLFSYMVIVSQRTAPGLISDKLMSEFHMAASVIGLLTGAQFLAYAGLQIPIGIFSDRFGPNVFLVTGTLFSGIGTFLYSISPNEACLLVSRVLAGMGDATIWINLVLILSQWFYAKEFVGLIGYAGMAGSVGSLLATVPLTAWISASGWRQPFFVTGILLLASTVMLYVVLIRLPQKREGGTHANTKVRHEKMLLVLKRILKSRQAWAAFLCHFGLVGTYVGFIGTWAVPYGMHIFGMNRPEASQLVMTGLIGAIIGAPVTGWIASRLGSRKKPYLLIQTLIFLAWTVFFLCGGKPPLFFAVLLMFVIGYGNGASALTFAVVRHSFDVREVGSVSGFANTGGFLSAVLLPSLFGKVLDHFNAADVVGYHYGFLIPAFFSLFGVLGTVMIREKIRAGESQAA
ncbi:MFS transporter [Heyndrickxia coagulans]|uniref:MFS transporter n=1 Tax=Heyndrickxia coagulans TaxID=1398 RepID=UPI002811B678|nr:MFS transporter [Heyndrickxia coagulans]WMM90190.1 MFS transporter [Heyndrickxia coagulans]